MWSFAVCSLTLYNDYDIKQADKKEQMEDTLNTNTTAPVQDNPQTYEDGSDASND